MTLHEPSAGGGVGGDRGGEVACGIDVDGGTCDAGLAGVLDTVAVEIVPDEVADGGGLVVAEVGVGVVLALAESHRVRLIAGGEHRAGERQGGLVDVDGVVAGGEIGEAVCAGHRW